MRLLSTFLLVELLSVLSAAAPVGYSSVHLRRSPFPERRSRLTQGTGVNRVREGTGLTRIEAQAAEIERIITDGTEGMELSPEAREAIE